MSAGLGVMIVALGGNAETLAAVQASLGQEIRFAAMADDTLRLTLADNSILVIEDNGQSCCETRYMTCDDDLPGFSGATLVSVETREAPSVADDSDEHEVQFLVVTTSKGAITCETHNQHNGFYGGFAVQARRVTP